MVQGNIRKIMFTAQVINTYCSLLRKALGFSTSDMLTGSTLNAEDIDSLIRLAQIQGTAPLVYDQLLKADSPLSDEAQMQLKQACMQNMIGFEQLLSLLKLTWNGLVSGGVQPVVLKGFGLASLYPIPYLRSWGDLDIYVGPEQYHQAAAILRQVFPHAEHPSQELETVKHYNFDMPEGVVEMHRTAIVLPHPCDNKYCWKLEHQAMNPANVQWVEIEDMRFAIPEAKFNLLFTFLHAWEHFVESGVGMKQLCDLALLAHHTYNQQSISSYMRKHLRRLRLYEPWQLIGYVCVTALGLPKSEWPLYEEGGARLQARRERFLTQVMNNGLTPRPQSDEDNNQHLNYFARKWKTLSMRLAKARLVAPYSPHYARHMVASTIAKGCRRLLTEE